MTTEAIDRLLNRLYGEVRQTLVQLDRAVVSRDWGTCMERATALNELLHRQIGFEEGAVFPAAFGDAATAQAGHADVASGLQAEHISLRNLAALLRMSSPAHDPEGWESVLRELEEQIERHIEAESAGLARWGRIDPIQAGDIDSLLERHLPETQAAAHEHFIDVSAMEPPGPFVHIMEQLSLGRVPLRVRIHREPLPLYAALAERGFAYRTRRLDDGCFEIRIVRAADVSANQPGIA